MKRYLKGAGAFALGMLMLTLGEAAGLNVHGLNPQLRQVIGNLADARPVILARAPYAVYNTAAGGNPTSILSFTFPGYSLAAGDMIRMQVFGVVINNNAGVQNFSVSAQAANGGGPFQSLGGRIVTVQPAAGNPNLYVEWRAEFLYSVGVGSALIGGNYVPPISASAVTQGGTYSSGLQANDAISFYGAGWLIVTDFATSGAVFSGGAIAASSGGIGLQRPIIFQNALPIQIDVQISQGNATMPVTVNAGVMEGL